MTPSKTKTLAIFTVVVGFVALLTSLHSEAPEAAKQDLLCLRTSGLRSDFPQFQLKLEPAKARFVSDTKRLS